MTTISHKDGGIGEQSPFKGASELLEAALQYSCSHPDIATCLIGSSSPDEVRKLAQWVTVRYEFSDRRRVKLATTTRAMTRAITAQGEIGNPVTLAYLMMVPYSPTA